MGDDLFEKFKKVINNFLNKDQKKQTEENKKIEENKEGGIVDNKKGNKLFSMALVVLIGILLAVGNKALNSKGTTSPAMNMEEKEVKLNTQNENKDKDLFNKESLQEYGEKLNEKLKHTLELIEGVGKVETMIYFDGGEEHVPAINVNNSLSKTEESDNNGGKRKINQNNDGRTIVVLNEGDKTKPLITKTKAPKITGICIVAEGANNNVTELRITQAIINLFNLPQSKVHVYPMKK